MKNEGKFIEELERRAKLQRRVVETEVLPSWARGVGEWLVIHPWRVLVPVALLVYGTSHLVYGEGVREFVLAIFGGFGR